jgi:hypothetical protein
VPKSVVSVMAWTFFVCLNYASCDNKNQHGGFLYAQIICLCDNKSLTQAVVYPTHSSWDNKSLTWAFVYPTHSSLITNHSHGPCLLNPFDFVMIYITTYNGLHLPIHSSLWQQITYTGPWLPISFILLPQIKPLSK